jgi:hypothetical protein
MFNNKFEWFTGVVEDRNDPLMMSRVRVRCLGIHTADKSALPTEDLPWATVMMPTTSSGMTGLQESHHGLVKGSWVVGFFRDGEDMQDPMVMGSLSSMSTAASNGAIGFNDPSGEYPKENLINQPDVHSFARGVDTPEGLVNSKKASVTKSVPTAKGTNWSEPETKFAPVYPFNHVHQSESGHVSEIDDTEGAERLHQYHRTGTFREVSPDGTVVERVVKDKYEIIYGDDYVNIKGNVKLTIDANCETYVKGNWDIKVDKNMTFTVGGDLSESVAGDKSSVAGGTDDRTAGGNMQDRATRIDHN